VENEVENLPLHAPANAVDLGSVVRQKRFKNFSWSSFTAYRHIYSFPLHRVESDIWRRKSEGLSTCFIIIIIIIIILFI